MGRERRSKVILGVVGFLLLALLGACGADSQDKDQMAKLTAGGCRYDTKSDAGSDHVTNPPAYKVNPPSGGSHTPQAAVAGIYDAAQVPPDAPIVHAMEHGFIVIWYRPADAEAKEGAEALGDEFSDETLVIPRPSLPVPVAATAWHRRLLCDSFEHDALAEFIQGFRDKGPEKGFLP